MVVMVMVDHLVRGLRAFAVRHGGRRMRTLGRTVRASRQRDDDGRATRKVRVQANAGALLEKRRRPVKREQCSRACHPRDRCRAVLRWTSRVAYGWNWTRISNGCVFAVYRSEDLRARARGERDGKRER